MLPPSKPAQINDITCLCVQVQFMPVSGLATSALNMFLRSSIMTSFGKGIIHPPPYGAGTFDSSRHRGLIFKSECSCLLLQVLLRSNVSRLFMQIRTLPVCLIFTFLVSCFIYTWFENNNRTWKRSAIFCITEFETSFNQVYLAFHCIIMPPLCVCPCRW